MKFNFSLLEFSFNSNIQPANRVHDALFEVGFVMRTEHENKSISMWNQQRCIILLRDTPHVTEFKLTGIGFMLDGKIDPEFSAEYDSDLDMYITHDPNGLKLLFVVDPATMDTDLDRKFTMVDTGSYDQPGLTNFSGVVYNTANKDKLVSFYKRLGFTLSKDSLLTSNKQFAVIVNQSDNDHVSAIYTEVDNVFESTAKLIVRDVDLKQYQNYDTAVFENLSYKINGYNCLAFGNADSYSIENMIVKPFADLDVIIRTRKQYMHTEASNIRKHYE